MKKLLLCTLLLSSGVLSANQQTIFSDDFFAYHLQAAMQEIENEDVFKFIEENVNNLSLAGTSDFAATELIHLIEAGCKIDSFNMAKVIETLNNANASKNATKVLIAALDYENSLNSNHLATLIETLSNANAANNATKVLLKAIECGIPFGPKERLLLAEKGKEANAKKHAEKILNALHERSKK